MNHIECVCGVSVYVPVTKQSDLFWRMDEILLCFWMQKIDFELKSIDTF